MEWISDIYGNQLEPSGLVYREDVLQIAKAAEAIIAFRNIVALVSTLPAWAALASHPSSTPANPLWSDAWSLYPVEVSVQDTLITSNPALAVGSHPKTPFVGMPNPLIPLYRDPYPIDWPLFALLLHAWDEYYLRGRRLSHHRQLFRSLEIAMHALALPTHNLSSVYDFGLSLSIWVSSFEVLLHPGGRDKVDETRVLTHLKDLKSAKPPMNRVLFGKRYVIEIKRQRQRVSWLERIYHQLYLARNAYLHGNPIRTNHWRYDGRNASVPIGNVAPLLFRTALKLQLGWRLPVSLDEAPKGREEWALLVAWCDRLYEDAMIKTM